ncbi:unnamed protein product [Leptidea sinapis]|uniref:Uncharacterized protein n=1 Tax=Leptidea sinapis TaxID=189913 RepID=A0A5E4PRL0_9NEOP|nr:unnamed protein product [Leptidea sinapis]
MTNLGAGQAMNVILLVGVTVLSCILIHYLFKIFFGGKKSENKKHKAESEVAVVSDLTEPTVEETRTILKNKKRAPWKTKTEYTHPWLLKNLKGHPGTVLMMDFSANGKFMAATCDGHGVRNTRSGRSMGNGLVPLARATRSTYGVQARRPLLGYVTYTYKAWAAPPPRH